MNESASIWSTIARCRQNGKVHLTGERRDILSGIRLTVIRRVISVEMIEAVGAEFMDTYWNVVDWALKIDKGVAVVQVITLPEART